MENSLVFISHASDDRYYAETLADYIVHTMNGVKTFVASDPASISSGGDWLREILENLSDADAVVVIYSRNARSRMWVGFELGYIWRKHEGERIHCVYDPQVELPSPLNERQGKDMTELSAMRSFFEGLASDLSTTYSVDHDRLPDLLAALPEYDPFSTWKSYLRNWEGWDEQTIQTSEDRSVRQWTYLPDPSYQIEVVSNGWREYDALHWARNKGLNTDGSNPQLGYNVNLKISGNTIRQEKFYSWDTSRYFVPSPDLCRDPSDDFDSESFYYYDRSSLKYMLAMMIGEYSNYRYLSEFARRCSITIVGDS